MNTVFRPSRLCHQLPAAEEPVARGNHAEVRTAAPLVFRAEVDAPRPGGVVVAGDQQEAMDIALLQRVQDDDCFVAGGKRRVTQRDEPFCRVSLADGKLNRGVGFVDAVKAGRSADQDQRHVALPDQFRRL